MKYEPITYVFLGNVLKLAFRDTDLIWFSHLTTETAKYELITSTATTKEQHTCSNRF